MGINPTSRIRFTGKQCPRVRIFLSALILQIAVFVSAAELLIDDSNPLTLPLPGAHILRILTPTTLELTLITTKAPPPAPLEHWNFVATNGTARLPSPGDFSVSSGAEKIPVARVGFKRRVLYAPLRQRDLRIANELYLVLTQPIPSNAIVEVRNPSGRLWASSTHFRAQSDPLRWSPVLHANQVGYAPDSSKKGFAGFYLGNLGELPLAGQPGSPPPFAITDARTGKEVFSGTMKPRRDSGFPFTCYQDVWEADFSSLKAPGEYRLTSPGVGVSYPFWVGDGAAAAVARAYALGLYHQRCGTNNVLPFTRHTHDVCHIAPASVPLPQTNYVDAWSIIAQKPAEGAKNPRHVAPLLQSPETCLYPFVRRGQLDVSGGHHDAGDYSKYTINSALLVHILVFAADNFRGVADLDNLGLPESGDGKSDVLQEAKWEADFLAKLQDDDGGFYFLVYPREREYESNVLPENGDPQIVWPKTTSATAAAVAALAQCSASPIFKKQFPEAAALYLQKAKKGWAFLERAIQKYGKDGAYQKLTHYGDEFMHDDEIAWATCEMFLATKDQALHTRLRHLFNPADAELRKWGWWRLYEGWGCATRSYAFGARSGRVAASDLDLSFLTRCEDEVISAAQDEVRRADRSAYGTSFPIETKRVRSAGWYFSCDPAFDLATAYQLDYPVNNDPRPRFLEAILTNLGYQLGCNPVNVCFLTGLGTHRQREIVSQYALNDRRVLPPAGIPIGELQSGFGWLDLYQQELGALTFPPDGDNQAPYPIYDRWGDSFNLSTEFVILQQARGLATAAFLMARGSLKSQPWKPIHSEIVASPATSTEKRLLLRADTDELPNSRLVWEASGEEPTATSEFRPRSANPPNWVEVEALTPSGLFLFDQSTLPTTARTSVPHARK